MEGRGKGENRTWRWHVASDQKGDIDWCRGKGLRKDRGTKGGKDKGNRKG